MTSSGTGEAEMRPAEEENVPQEGEERKGETQEVAEETRRVDQATFESEEFVEREGDYKEAEAIEAAFVETVEAPTVARMGGEPEIDSSPAEAPVDEDAYRQRENLIGPADQPPLEVTADPSLDGAPSEAQTATVEAESGAYEAPAEVDTTLEAPITEAEVQLGEVKDPTDDTESGRDSVQIPYDGEDDGPVRDTGGVEGVEDLHKPLYSGSSETIVEMGDDVRAGEIGQLGKIDDPEGPDSGTSMGFDLLEELGDEIPPQVDGRLDNLDPLTDVLGGPHVPDPHNLAQQNGLDLYPEPEDLSGSVGVGADPRIADAAADKAAADKAAADKAAADKAWAAMSKAEQRAATKTMYSSDPVRWWAGKIWSRITKATNDDYTGGSAGGIRGIPNPEGGDYTSEVPQDVLDATPIDVAESMMQPVGDEETRAQDGPPPMTLEDAMAGNVDLYGYWDGEGTDGLPQGGTGTVDADKPGEELIDPPEFADGTEGGSGNFDPN